jgi:LmbE family N-acetylglucosaminyl deacetylase
VAELIDAAPGAALAVYAHPDDPEVSCGGTLARWAAAGTRVHIAICTRGEKGSSDPAVETDDLAARRRQEVEAARLVTGVIEVHHLDHPDGEIENDTFLRGQLVGLIRRIRPEAVIGPDPTATFFGQTYVNHRDHRVVGWAILDAVSPAAASPHYFPETGPPHLVRDLYLSGTLEPNAWVDISTTIETKAEALACHVSQIGETAEWLRAVVGDRAEEAGKAAGVRYAEAFRRVVLASPA